MRGSLAISSGPGARAIGRWTRSPRPLRAPSHEGSCPSHQLAGPEWGPRAGPGLLSCPGLPRSPALGHAAAQGSSQPVRPGEGLSRRASPVPKAACPYSTSPSSPVHGPDPAASRDAFSPTSYTCILSQSHRPLIDGLM